MSGDCPNCAALQQQVARLMGGIASTRAFIDQELEEPTMQAKPPRNGPHRGPYLITSVQARLGSTLNSAY